jgi:hypothetical protein
MGAHFTPFFDDTDLAQRPNFDITARILNNGTDAPPFSLSSPPLPDLIPGRAEQLRQAARACTGLSRVRRDAMAYRHQLATGEPGPNREGGQRFSLPHSPAHSVPHSLAQLERGSEWGTPGSGLPQVRGGAR